MGISLLDAKSVIFLTVILVIFNNCGCVFGHENETPDSVKNEQLSAKDEQGVTSKDTNTKDADAKDDSGKILSWQLYRRLFEQNRAVQLDAVKTMQNYGEYAQRYKLVDIVLQQLFKKRQFIVDILLKILEICRVLGEAKVNLTEWGFAPGNPFPTNQTIREGVSKALENTAMFGELVLRLPDIVHEIYDKKREWQQLIAWGVWFCQQSDIFDKTSPTAELLNLMSQEINLIERDDDYINPFTSVNMKVREEELEKRVEGKKKIKDEKKKERKRGPRMSGGSRTEL